MGNSAPASRDDISADEDSGGGGSGDGAYDASVYGKLDGNAPAVVRPWPRAVQIAAAYVAQAHNIRDA